MTDPQQQIERLKAELAAYLEIAERLGFPKEEVEKQINLYLDDLNQIKKGIKRSN